MPESRMLRLLIGWFATGALLSVFLSLFRKNRTIEDAVGNFFTDLILPYMYGAFVSRLPFVWLSAVICGVIFAIGVTNLTKKTAKMSNLALLAILLFSLFTVWIEPFTSVPEATVNVALQLAKVPMKVFDLGVSACWLLVYVKASLAIAKERRLANSSPSPTAAVPLPGQRPKRTALVAAVVLGCFTLFLGLWVYYLRSL